jgi:hypothetical protein
MKRARFAVPALFAAAALSTAAAGAAEPLPTHRADLRVAYLAGALAAVRDTPAETLAQGNEYARSLVRGACSSSVQRLEVECLMTAARRYCQNRGAAEAARCDLYMDIVASNVLADQQLISSDRRYEIMRRFKDWRRALARETSRFQGALAAQFRLRMGAADDDAGMAKRIDQFCLTTSDETNLAWQSCAAALVWFVRK